MTPAALACRLPLLDWGRRYDRRTLGADLLAAGIVTVMLVPQSLAYARLAGLPPETGIYASIAPILLYAVFGTSRALAVGPVAVVSLMMGTLAAMRRQRIDADQELIGLGAANLGAAFTGGMPVTGGFARSVVNLDAGAETPAAGAFTALGLLIAALALTPLLFFLPQATLAATIIIAVLGLVDLGLLRRARAHSRADVAAVAATILLTLGLGVEAGVTAGVLLSLALHLAKVARPHLAEVGLVPGTQHFRNIRRHRVETDPEILSVRIDESLSFLNARGLEEWVLGRIASSPVRHVVLMASAVDDVDCSALEMLESLNHRLREAGIALHLSEAKGPVMDRLARTDLLRDLTGRVFLSHFEAVSELKIAEQPEAAE